MLSTQPQACPPARSSRLPQTVLAGFSPLAQAAFFENNNSRFLSGATGKHFDFDGVGYELTASYHFPQLDDVYRKHCLSLVASRAG